jgi:hypothetical protein
MSMSTMKFSLLLLSALVWFICQVSSHAAWPSWKQQQQNIDAWMPHFQAAAQKHGVPVDLLIGIASRETGVRNLLGDYEDGSYQAFGVLQVARGDAPQWVKDRGYKDVADSIMKGAEILAAKRDQILALEGKQGSVRSSRSGKNYRFTGAKIASQADLWRITAAAFNAGLWSYYSYSHGGSPDKYTTDKNYSAEIESKSLSLASSGKVVSCFSAEKSLSPAKTELAKAAPSPIKPAPVLEKPVMPKPAAATAQAPAIKPAPGVAKPKPADKKAAEAVAKAPATAEKSPHIMQSSTVQLFKPAPKQKLSLPVPAKQPKTSAQKPAEPERTAWIELKDPWLQMHKNIKTKLPKGLE